MKIGYFGINSGPLTSPQQMTTLLQCAEGAGFESVWTGEHVVVVDPQPPPSPVQPALPFVDTVATLAFAAGVTSKLKLGSGIILLAQRNPVVLAKELSSIDVLSGGRLIFGVGVGYVKEEFEVIGVPYRQRGARVSEHIEAIRALWTQERPEFEGRFTKITGVQQRPMPVQSPHPPIIIGGGSKPAYRRAVTQGDGWYGFALTEEQTAAGIEGLREAGREADRESDFDRLEISITPRDELDADRIKRYEDLGVQRLILLARPVAGEGEPLDAVRRFIEQTGETLIRA